MLRTPSSLSCFLGNRQMWRFKTVAHSRRVNLSAATQTVVKCEIKSARGEVHGIASVICSGQEVAHESDWLPCFCEGLSRGGWDCSATCKCTQSDKPIKVLVENDHGWVANQDALFISLLILCMRGMQIFRRTWKTSSWTAHELIFSC